MLKKLLTAIIVFLFIPIFIVNSFAYSFPGKAVNYVTDFANILSDSEEQVINEKLKNFESTSSNQIFIATINSLDGDTVENYSVKLFWIGQINCWAKQDTKN